MFARLCLPLLLACGPALGGPVAPPQPLPLCGTAYDPAERTASRGPDARLAPPDIRHLVTAPPVDPALRGSIRRVDLPAGVKLVALTFDLCEVSGQTAGYDGAIVETLKQEGVAATFFAGGHWAATHPARFSELAHRPDFEIGNHSWTHQNTRVISAERLESEIRAPLAVFRHEAEAPACPARDAFRPGRLFRFPFGACDAASMKAVNDAGLLAIQWDVSTGDPSPGQSADAIVRQTLAHVRPGSIVLAHANGRGWHMAEALPKLIAALRRQGYQFATVEELLSFGTPVVAGSCYDSRPGDADRYDHFLGAGLLAQRKVSR
jgi:peptidoglycan-N-acetylglucosamine deacetylase